LTRCAGRARIRETRRRGLPVDEQLIDRCRALGEERIRVSAAMRSREDWQEKWPAPKEGFPFSLAHWRHCACYTVGDYAAEAGFWIDVVGLPSTMFGPDDALVTGPDGEFAFQVVGVGEGDEPTPRRRSRSCSTSRTSPRPARPWPGAG
jgi:hypothetical protein